MKRKLASANNVGNVLPRKLNLTGSFDLTIIEEWEGLCFCCCCGIVTFPAQQPARFDLDISSEGLITGTCTGENGGRSAIYGKVNCKDGVSEAQVCWRQIGQGVDGEFD